MMQKRVRTYGKLREQMRKKHHTIGTLAEKLGINRTTLGKKLLGQAALTSTEIEAIVDLLDIDANDIHEYFFY